MTLKQKWIIWIGFIFVCVCIGALTGLQSAVALPFLGLVSTLFVIVAAIPGYYELIRTSSAKTGVSILLGLSLFAYLIEIIGVKTGFPYSTFSYAPSLESFIIAGVPWTTSFGWVPFILASYFVARYWIHQKKSLLIVLISPLFLVTFDLVLDPGAVWLGLWSYGNPGLYYNVPWQNFAGWLLTGTIALFGVHAVLSRITLRQSNVFAFLIGPATLLSFWVGITLSAGQTIPTGIGCLLLLFLTATWKAESTKIRSSQQAC